VMKAIMTLSHRILVMHFGQMIAEGSPEEVGRDRGVIKAYLGDQYLYASHS